MYPSINLFLIQFSNVNVGCVFDMNGQLYKYARL